MKIIISVYFILLFFPSAISQTVFKFTGNGYWTDSTNWQNNLVPPDSLQAYDTIFISSAATDSCVLNKQQIVLPGAAIVVNTNANFVVRNGIILSAGPKLKKIIYPKDTITPLCSPPSYCPPTISQEVELFTYDSMNRIVKRVLTTTFQTDTFTTNDTTHVFAYFYDNGSQNISGYSHLRRYADTIAEHVLIYDNLNRLITDSIVNPREGNNKITHFYYGADTVIEHEKQVYPAGIQYRMDTMLLSGRNVYKVNRSTMSWKHDFLFSNYRNPLSYVNNFSLMASDRKNAGASDIFMIYYPEFITYNQVSESTTQYLSSGQPVQYGSTYTITADIFNRIEIIRKSSSGNKATTFEYY